MKTLKECIAEGFEPTRKNSWFEYKRDYVRRIWKLAEKMGFEKSFGYNRWCYYYNIELPEIPDRSWDWVNHTRGYYFSFLDCDGQCLPEMRIFISNPWALDTALLSTYPTRDFKYAIVPENVILDMFTRFDHPDKFLMYLENWKNIQILEEL